MLKKFTIKSRLVASFSLLALLLLAVSIVNFYSLKVIAIGSQEMYETNTQPLPHAGEIGILFERIRVNIRDAYMEPDVAQRQKYFDKIHQIEKKIDEHMSIFQKSLVSKETKDAFTDLRKEMDAFYVFGNELAKLGSVDGDQQKGLAMIQSKCREMAETVEDALAQSMELKSNQAKKLDKETDALAHKAKILSIALSSIGLIAAVSMGVLISLSLITPINTMRDMLMDIAQGEGDLTKRLPEDGKDEIAETSRWFNTFITKLSGIISETSSLAERLANESAILSTTAEQMASGAEGVSAKSATLATAAEEMSATSHDIANNCHMAADSATMASETSQKGASIAKATTEGIRYRIGQTRINAEAISLLGSRSDQIGEIVGTIEDIADQTNLLALNAAIEAARAGEMGRGFAVVADEVRALAERTTKATKEISDMIRTIQKDTKAAVDAMQAGVSTSQKAIDDSETLEKALAEIMDQVGSVTMQVSQIATAAEEQTATTHEISTNIQQSSLTLEETANGAHQTARAAAHLDSLAEQLKKLVGTFRW